MCAFGAANSFPRVELWRWWHGFFHLYAPWYKSSVDEQEFGA